MRQQVSGRETVQEVELIEGRHHPGQKSWILRLNGIESVDQVTLIGAVLMGFLNMFLFLFSFINSWNMMIHDFLG